LRERKQARGGVGERQRERESLKQAPHPKLFLY